MLPIAFENILWLVLGMIFISVFVLIFFLKQKTQNFWDIHTLEEVYTTSSYFGKLYFACILWVSILFFVILAWPYISSSLKTVKKNGIDIELVFDVSYSMNAADLPPSRIEVAREVSSRFIWELDADRLGVILFAGKPFQSVPLSYDYGFLQDFISHVSTDIIVQNTPHLQGTAIGDGLLLASDVLLGEGETSQREKIIILITDGEANRGIKPEIALKYLKEKNITVYSVWVGKNKQSYVEVPTLWGFTQKIAVWAVDEVMLKKISKETGGKYFRADSPQSFEDIFRQISKLEKTELEFEQIDLHSSVVHYCIYVLVLTFLGLWYIIFIKKIKV